MSTLQSYCCTAWIASVPQPMQRSWRLYEGEDQCLTTSDLEDLVTSSEVGPLEDVIDFSDLSMIQRVLIDVR